MCLAIVTSAYSIGLGASWFGLAMLLGIVIDWWLIAPYLRAHMTTSGADTLSRWFAATAGDKLQRATLQSAGIITVVALGLAAITSLQWAGIMLSAVMGMHYNVAVALVVVILLTTTLLAGLWSASFNDALAAIAVLVIFIVAAGACLGSLHGMHTLARNLTLQPAEGRWFGGYVGLLSVSMVTGLLFTAFGSAAQPHVITRYVACRDDASIRRARWIALGWSFLCVVCLLTIGWSARVLLQDAAALDGRQLFFAISNAALNNALAGIAAACLSVGFSIACVSPWLAMATQIVGDAMLRRTQALSLPWSRFALTGVAIGVGVGAIYIPLGDEDRFWFAWQSIGAAFGPLLLVRLTGKRVRPGSSLGAMWSGFVLTILFHLMPDTPGDLLERSLPFIASLGIALSGGERRRNPDRADRGDKTVHDHLPI
jgi:sodium/proline symporter